MDNKSKVATCKFCEKPIDENKKICGTCGSKVCLIRKIIKMGEQYKKGLRGERNGRIKHN